MKPNARRAAVRTARQPSLMAWLPIGFALVPLAILLWAIPLTTGNPVG